jgi:hypothetical protein
MKEKSVDEILDEEGLGFSTDSAYVLADRGRFNEAYRFINEYEKVNSRSDDPPETRRILNDMYGGIRKYIEKKQSKQ